MVVGELDASPDGGTAITEVAALNQGIQTAQVVVRERD